MPRGKSRARNPELYNESSSREVTHEAAKKAYEPTAEQVEAVKKMNEDRNKSRLAMMEAIADSADEIKAPELLEFDGENAIERSPEEQAELEAQHESEQAERELAELKAKELQVEGAEEETEPEGDHRVIDGTDYYLTIVNGQEKWLTLSQLRETASKVSAADEYLQAAKDSARKAAELELSPTEDVPAGLDENELRDTLRAVSLGDEQATNRLASVLARLSAPKVDGIQQIDQRVNVLNELAAARAAQREILDDPYLVDVFNARLARIKSEAPTTNITEAFTRIGAEIRKAFPDRFKKSGVVTLDDKATRKRSLPAPVKSAGKQVAETDEEEDESVEQTIANMAKARGQVAKVYAKGFTTHFDKTQK